MAAIPRTDWAKRFTYRLVELGTRADPDMLYAMGEELFDSMGQISPEQAAEAEFREWPPHDD